MAEIKIPIVIKDDANGMIDGYMTPISADKIELFRTNGENYDTIRPVDLNNSGSEHNYDISYKNSSGGTIPLNRYNYNDVVSYTDGGKIDLVSITDLGDNGKTIITSTPKGKIESTYDVGGSLERRTNFDTSGNKSFVETYGKNNQLLNRTSYSATGDVSETTQYEYDLAGLETKVTTYDKDNNVKSVKSTQRFDDGSKLVTTDGAGGKTIENYSINGKKVSEDNYNQDGIKYASTKFEYDEATGLQTGSKRYNEKNEVVSTTEIQRFDDGSSLVIGRDKDGKITSSTSYKNGEKIGERYNHEYDALTKYDNEEKISSFKSNRDYYKDAKDASGKDYYVKYDKDGKVIEAIDKSTGERVNEEQLKNLTFTNDEKVNDFRSKADNYATLSTDDNFVGGHIDNENMSRLNGIDSRDRDDMHDEFMHEGHVTQAANLGYTGDRPESFHEMEDGTVDEKGNPNYKTDENNTPYEAGKVVQLAENVNLKIMANTSYKGYTGNVFGNNDPSTFSKLDYIATYAAGGQYSVQDLALTADALEANGVKFNNKHPAKYFNGTAFEGILNDLNSENNWMKSADQLRGEVDQIKDEWKSLHDKMVDWAGEAGTAGYEAIQDIIGKFEVTMGNIENALIPACDAADNLKSKLDELKKEEATLKDLEQKEIEAKAKLAGTEKRKVIHHEGSRDSKTGYMSDGWDEVIDPTDEWKAANEAAEAATQAVEEQRTKMDKITLEALKYYYQIKNFQQALQTFSSFFKGGSNSHFVADRNSVLAFHDTGAWKEYFEDYVNMPVITNLSDYHEGDVIVHDDAHGLAYVVTGAFDPLTGTITIGCIDKDGNRRGSDVTIWDQREIVPIKYVREYDKEYKDYPDKVKPTVPPTEAKTVPRTTPEPGPGGPGHDPEPPKPTSPPPTPTTPPPVPTTPPTPATPPLTMPPTKPYVPGITPSTTIDYVAPHTGLDAVYQSNNNADTSQSSASLGALAGLAVGAAGLGLTGLMGEKEEKEEKEENIEKHAEEEKNENEEEKPFVNILEKKDETAVDEK